MLNRSLLTLCLIFIFLSGCTSQTQLDIQKSHAIQASTDTLAASTPRARSILLTTGTDNRGTLDVYGDLRSPTRLELTFGLSNSKIVINYYFLDRALIRSTVQRFYARDPDHLTQYQTTPNCTCDTFFENDRVIAQQSSGDPAHLPDLAQTQRRFVNPTFINQLLKGTRATGIDFDFVSDPPQPPVYYAD